MSDETETEVVEAVAETPADDVAAPLEAEAGLSAEDRALAMGWTPKAQFKGDPEKWVGAETFVKRGEEFLPFLKANNRRLEQALERTRADMARLAKHHEQTAAREYKRAMEDIQARLDHAASQGDVEGVRAATDDLVELSKESRDTPKPEEEDAQALFDEWRAENTWFDENPVMRGAAIEVARELDAKGIGGKARGVEITKRIKAEFPSKFENPNRRQAAAVEGGGTAQRKAGKSRSDLPPDARQFMERMVKQGLMTEAQYLKDFFG